mgnify:CR=1 FL=1
MGVISLAAGPNGGLDCPVEAFTLFHQLLNRDLTLAVDGDRLRVSGPHGSKPALSEGETAAIRKWKAHLQALLLYVPPEKPFD